LNKFWLTLQRICIYMARPKRDRAEK
jgi:hypothetical protein